MSKTIITASITGNMFTPSMTPNLPITPKEIADDAIRIREAGAAVAYIHVRNPETGEPSLDVGLAREIAERVKSKCDIILCFNTNCAPGLNDEDRFKVITELKPELATLGAGSCNYNFSLLKNLAIARNKKWNLEWEEKYIASSRDFVSINSMEQIAKHYKLFTECGTRAEFEVYDLAMLTNLEYLVEEKSIDSPLYIQFLFGFGGLKGNLPSTIENLLFMHNTAKQILPGYIWSAAGTARFQFSIANHAMLMGGNIRVGIGDNVFGASGPARSSAEHVEKMLRIAQEHNIEPASPAEAREILGLKGLDKVNF